MASRAFGLECQFALRSLFYCMHLQPWTSVKEQVSFGQVLVIPAFIRCFHCGKLSIRAGQIGQPTKGRRILQFRFQVSGLAKFQACLHG